LLYQNTQKVDISASLFGIQHLKG